MKKIIFFLFLISINTKVFSQTEINIPTKFPTEFGKYTFSLGSKIILELKEMGNNKYEYKVLSIEPITDYYSFKKNENLFSENPKKNTVELYFMGAFYDEGKEDKDWKTLLTMRNNLEVPITFKADIKYYYSEKFENTSIVGKFPKVKSNEIWANKIDYIVLYDFEKLNKK